MKSRSKKLFILLIGLPLVVIGAIFYLFHLSQATRVEAANSQVIVRPNDTGYYSSWTASNTNDYTDTSDQSDVTYIFTGSASNYDVMNLENLTISVTSTINWIQVHVKCKALGSGGGEKFNLIERVNDVDYLDLNGQVVSRADFTEYVGIQRAANPYTIVAWTKADIDALQAGVKPKTLGTGETLQCSEVWVVVDYSEGPPPSPIARPDAVGTYQGWNTFGSGTGHFDRTSDLSDNSGVEITGSTIIKETENLTNFNEFGIINSITAFMRAKASGSGGPEKTVIIWRTNSTDYESSSNNINRNNFTNYSETRVVNPYTGLAWTWSEINALEIGSRATNLGNSEKIQVSEFWIEVNYTPTQPVTSYNQNTYRFYVDNDEVQPTDPWPAGIVDLNENSAITTDDNPPDDNDLVRLRMSVLVNGLELPANSQSFKLQYGEGATCSSITNWQDVGQSSSTAIWRGEVDGLPADGTTLTNTLLTTSDVVESYEEQNNSTFNSNAIAVGQDGEWDWLIQNNGAPHDTSYCFRMVRADGTPLDGYTNYPEISTQTTIFDSSFEGGNGENFVKPYSGDPNKIAFNSELDSGTASPVCTSWAKQNWFYFKMDHVLNQSINFTLINALANNNENTYFSGFKPVYSYDQVSWYRIDTAGSINGNNFVFTAPGGGAKFTADTVYLAHGRPYTYTNYLNDLSVWQQSPYVIVTEIGNSVNGRPMHLLTIKDPNSPINEADKQVHWLNARDHPMEPEGSRMVKGIIEFLIGDSDEAKLIRMSSIFKIVPMMNPDGVYEGWTTANAQLCNINRDWDGVTGPNVNSETAEVYNVHQAISDWLNNGLPNDIKTFTTLHTQVAGPGVYDGNPAIEENSYEDLFAILDGVAHASEFSSSGSSGMFNVAMYNQYLRDAFTVEGGTYKFGADYPTNQNVEAYGIAWLKTIFARHNNNLKVFALTQTDASGSTDQQNLLVGLPNQYFAVFNEDKGGGLARWYDRENDPALTNQLVDTDTILDKISWDDGTTYRHLHNTTNALLTLESNTPNRVSFKYEGLLGNIPGYNYVYKRTIWADGRIWSDFNFTNNSGSEIDWTSMDQAVSVDYADGNSFDYLYDNSDTTPTPGTDNWWGLIGNGTSGVKSVAIGHYIGQSGGWVYDTYGQNYDSVGKRNWYTDADGPILTNSSSISTDICYQIGQDNDLLGTEAQIDVYRNDIANPDTPIMTSGIFTEFDKQEGGLKFSTDNNYVKFTYTNAESYTKKKPTYIITGYTANTAPILKVNGNYLDSETGTAHLTDTYIGQTYTAYIDNVNDIVYLQYLDDISTNIDIEIKDSFQ